METTVSTEPIDLDAIRREDRSALVEMITAFTGSYFEDRLTSDDEERYFAGDLMTCLESDFDEESVLVGRHSLEALIAELRDARATIARVRSIRGFVPGDGWHCKAILAPELDAALEGL